eukprot:TRINITY_DN8892_c0_g1_i4.p1 TRINITY_DN8892_c0_g1~~TRINITY_DN8892_c0_g1_i4.p1  ORF type:complete len:1381 (-),score=144.81 TRINITY_DN8892_c0_g1_i4:150-4292(-)
MTGPRSAHGWWTSMCIWELMMVLCPWSQGRTVTWRIRGSCDFTSGYAKDCQDIKQALGMLTRRINEGALVQTLYRDLVSVDVDLHDDMGQYDMVESIYKKLFDEYQPFDVILGPYTSTLARAAIDVSVDRDRVIMLHSTGAQSLFENGYDKIFSTSPTTMGYFNQPIELLHKGGSRSIVSIHGQLNYAWDRELCEGGLQIAQRLGWNIVADMVLETVSSIIEKLRKIVWSDVDVLLLCISVSERNDLLLFTKFLDISPKAVLIPGNVCDFVSNPIDTIDFLTIGGWNHTTVIDGVCPIWGSPSDFYSAYMTEFGEAPVSLVVEAVVGAQALIRAIAKRLVRRNGVWAISQKGLADELRTLNEPSILGRIRFWSNGTMISRKPSVYQVQSIATQNRVLRFTKCVEVMTNMSIKYPARKREETYLSVYPCEAGEEVNTTYVTTSPKRSYRLDKLCQPCPIGWARDKHEIACRRCSNGFFTLRPGRERCEACPKGANCSAGLSLENGWLPAAYGYHRYAGTSSMFYAACQEGLCLGNNLCIGNNDGVMCSSCKPYFTNTFRGRRSALGMTCRPCTSWGLQVVMSVVVFCSYWWLVVVVGKLVESSTNVFTNASCSFIKIAVNTLHVYGAVAKASAMPESRFTSVVLTLLFNPASFVFLNECVVFDESRFALTHALVGFFLIPCFVVMNFLMFLLAVSFIYWESWKRRTHLKRCARRIRNTERRILQWMITWVWLLYPCTLSSLLEACRCNQLEDVDSQRYLIVATDPSVECTGAEHSRLCMLCLFGMLFYGLGVPAVAMCVLHRKRDQLMTTPVKLTLGFLYNGFKPRFFYGEAFVLLRKFLLCVCLAFPQRQEVLVFVLFVCFTSLVMHAVCLPFDSQDLFAMNQLELLGNVVFTCKALAGLLHNAPNIGDHALFVDVYANYLEPTLQFAFACFTAWCLLRSILNRKLTFKHSITGNNGMRFWERAILRCTEPLLNRVVWNARSHRIYVGALSCWETVFFTHFVAQILRTYIHVVDVFSPKFVVIAFRETMAMCIAERRARVVAGLRLDVTATQVKDVDQSVTPHTSQRPVIVSSLGSSSASLEELQHASASLKELQHAILLCNADVMACRSTLFIVETCQREQDVRQKGLRRSVALDSFDMGSLPSAKLPQQRTLHEQEDELEGKEGASTLREYEQSDNITFDALNREHANLQHIAHDIVSELTVLRDKLLQTQGSVHETCTSVAVTGEAGSDVNLSDVVVSLPTAETTLQKTGLASFLQAASLPSLTNPAVDVAFDDCGAQSGETSVDIRCGTDSICGAAAADTKISVDLKMHEEANLQRHRDVHDLSWNLRRTFAEAEMSTPVPSGLGNTKSDVACEKTQAHPLALALRAANVFATVEH